MVKFTIDRMKLCGASADKKPHNRAKRDKTTGKWIIELHGIVGLVRFVRGLKFSLNPNHNQVILLSAKTGELPHITIADDYLD